MARASITRRISWRKNQAGRALIRAALVEPGPQDMMDPPKLVDDAHVD